MKLVNREGPDGSEEKQFDMLTYVITNTDISAQDVLVVNEHYVARPDLISLAVYGDDRYADILCKYNGISNPFEMNEGDVIYLPRSDEFRFMFGENIVASDFIDNDKTAKMNEKTFPFQKEKDERRTPSQQLVGETNYVIDKSLGVVFY